MAKIFKSKFKLVKRYARFSNTCVYFSSARRKKVRYGYKVYQKVFKRYRSKRTLRVNIRKPKVMLKRKSKFGKALEMKEKLTYLVGGIRANRFIRYTKISKSKTRSPLRSLLNKIESRLDFVLYRINIIQNPKLIKKLIRLGYIEVNEKPANSVNFNIRTNSKVDVKVPYYVAEKYRTEFAEAVKRKLVFKPSTDYIEVSYKSLGAILHSIPDEDNVFYPFEFNPFYFYRIYVGS